MSIEQALEFRRDEGVKFPVYQIRPLNPKELCPCEIYLLILPVEVSVK